VRFAVVRCRFPVRTWCLLPDWAQELRREAGTAKDFRPGFSSFSIFALFFEFSRVFP
jgi:hypothetical protein